MHSAMLTTLFFYNRIVYRTFFQISILPALIFDLHRFKKCISRFQPFCAIFRFQVYFSFRFLNLKTSQRRTFCNFEANVRHSTQAQALKRFPLYLTQNFFVPDVPPWLPVPADGDGVRSGPEAAGYWLEVRLTQDVSFMNNRLIGNNSYITSQLQFPPRSAAPVSHFPSYIRRFIALKS